MNPALSFVIPLYNSEQSIDELLTRLDSIDVPGGHEIVLVNDASRDATARLCRERIPRMRAPVCLVDLARNYGEHSAVMAGLHHASGEYAVTMDDDLQNPVEEAIRLFEAARDGGHDVVYGSYGEKKHGPIRNLGSRFANRVADWVLDKPPGLYLCSFRCMRRGLYRAICQYAGPYPYVDGILLQYTERIGTLPVRHEPRRAGRSGYNMRKLVRLWLQMFVNFSVLPLRVATLLGLLTGALGSVALAVILAEYLLVGIRVPGWISLSCGMTIFGATQLVLLGVMGEYVGRIYLTLNRKPQYHVREIVRREPASLP